VSCSYYCIEGHNLLRWKSVNVFGVLTKALVVMQCKETEGSADRQLVKCTCAHFFPLRMVRANQTSIQIPFTFWKIWWLIFAQVSAICILSSSSVVGNRETEGLPLANSRRKPVGVRYGDIGWRIITPRPSRQVESGWLSV